MDKGAHEIVYELRLFVSGASPNSARAITNLQQILDTHLPERYTLVVTDVRQEPDVARQEQIIALPMLLKIKPAPRRRMIGDMSDVNKVLNGLGISDE